MKNVLEFEAHAVVERQAREWLIRLDGDEPLADAEREALQRWLGSSPSHREELTRLSKFWSKANVLTELAVPLQLPRGRVGRVLRRPRLLWAAASAALAFLVLSLWWWQWSDQAANGIYTTAIGEQKTIQLHDRSSIQLNTDSQVRVAYERDSRRVYLLRGEALFIVAREPKRAFEVHAANGVVRAVGTAFAVHLEGGTVNVTVTNGVVEVAEIESGPIPKSGEQPRRTTMRRTLGEVKAGQMTTFGRAVDGLDVRDLAGAELQRRMAGHEGYLVFSGQPLSEVVSQVNRYSPVTLEIADPKLNSLAIGGRFRVGDLDAVLEVLRDDFGIQSSRLDERNVRLERAPAH